ncbi:type III PLP-dependent enzyme domain-containing protein [Undibacterium oligocarboniphilum]|uniref:Y4yA family PLP-dependent enzyme n=1 Tax=Undibacterium oligocarboniphilum TaxID=666702 RepID=A0A850QK09_9BURK|nr:Y4yA family PLP-dependent enzyme [Undibacterium oligocarboniphilum]MBC3869334.1 Y4yA family PLP-dependent enzyme [Undibacterium oligocarboniphilum]NVO77713.1 Y4yA family PLP-dependent enzyme [Undibacterium oligocarboniphilum]
MELTTNSMRACERAWAVDARQDIALLDQITRAVDGPFHLVHPESFAGNLSDFQRVLRDRNIAGQVYFGKKANKAGAWLREVARLGGAVDVASKPEFVHALANGIRGEDIGVTGAAKSDDLLWLACRHGAIVAIDALDELERAIAVAAGSNTENVLRILLRVLPPNSPNSRFGLNQDDLLAALQRCADARRHILMDGFSFHLDGYAVAPRAELAAALIDRCVAARGQGFPCSSVSIGGGFACSYVEEDDWRVFKERLDPAQFHAGKSFSHFYPYYQSPTGAAMLDAILQTITETGGGTLAARLIAADVQLYLEPGRALLDGAGMTVFPVQGFKRNAEHGIVTVAGLSMSLSEQWKNSEFLPAPFLVQRGPARPQNPVCAVIGGSSCMEYDVLTWRKITFPAVPRHGDLIVYPNTAGYQMDKNESEFHQLALPPKIVVNQHDGRFTWRINQ